MGNVIITTDSAICPRKKEGSIVIPTQIINSDKKSYPDNGIISNKQILQDMEKGIIYKTSSPLLGDFETTFRHELEQGRDVIHLSVGSSISAGSYNCANLIANQLNDEYKNKVYVVDTMTGGTGGTLFYELSYEKIIKNNDSIENIIEELNNLKKYIKSSFYVPNIDGYIRSGRDKTNSHIKDKILNTTSNIAKMASFKFRVDLNDNGELYLKQVFRSSVGSGMKKMVTEIVNENNITNFEPSYVALGSLYKDKVDLEEIKKYLLSFGYFKDVIEQDIGSVIAAYGCKDLCGISLVKKRR